MYPRAVRTSNFQPHNAIMLTTPCHVVLGLTGEMDLRGTNRSAEVDPVFRTNDNEDVSSAPTNLAST